MSAGSLIKLPFAHETNKPLAPFSTFATGGPASYFLKITTISQMQEVLRFCHIAKLPVYILGKGSNSLFDERGFCGAVLLNKIDRCHQEGPLFRVGAGYSFARLGQLTARLGYSGLEFAAAIPASVGGAVFMNAGANGQQTFDALHQVTYITKEGKRLLFTKEQMTFGYRNSCFQKMQGAIVEAIFSLRIDQGARAHQKEIVDYRLQTQPYKSHSCGCVFKNPPGKSAGALIEECGLKGAKVQAAAVSPKHANFIVNQGGATAGQICDLIAFVKEEVYQKSGVLLEEEIRYIPYTEKKKS